MLLKSIKLKNFRQYKGEQFLRFSTDKNKNISVILGDNTFGKTTLLQAFNWCLYEEVILPNPEELLNYDVSMSLTDGDMAIVEVEIELIHTNVNYIISRKQEYIKRNGSINNYKKEKNIFYKEKDGQTEAIKERNYDVIVNTILPKDLSNYFFFDTERVGTISNRKDLAESVKGLLGLTIIENAIKHLGTRTNKRTVIGYFYNSMDLEGDEKAKITLEHIQDAQNRRDILIEQLENNSNQMENYEKRKEQLEMILKDNLSTQLLQNKKEDLEARIKNETIEQKLVIEKFYNLYSNSAVNFFSIPLLSKTLYFLKNIEVDDKGVKDLTKITLEDIIRRGKCICGCDLTKDLDALKNIMEEMKFVPPESIGNTIRNYIEKININNSNSEKIFDSIQDKYSEINRIELRIQEWEDEIINISERIKGKENMKIYEEELFDIKQRLKKLIKKKEELIREDENKKSDIVKFQKLYDTQVKASGKNKALIQYINYAEVISSWLIDNYSERESYIRDNLENKVNHIFEKMYHGKRRVVLNSKYQATLLSAIADTEIESGESEGLNRVKNFAFIAGLVSLAKDKIVEEIISNSIDESTEPYPLVMDAPFSNADETHTMNISKVLPEVADQVIMFVMKKDWIYAEKVISNRIGVEATLEKYSETYSSLQEGKRYV